jgi:hypothetical protein
MGFIKKIGNFLLGGLVGGLLGLRHKGPKALPAPVTRDDAREQADANDELRRRRGAAADMVTGTQGAEAAASSVGRFIPGS